MTQDEIKEYQLNIKPWQPGADVTIKDCVIHGLVDYCVTEANAAIEKVMRDEELW
jgi:hypothetical protein